MIVKTKRKRKQIPTIVGRLSKSFKYSWHVAMIKTKMIKNIPNIRKYICNFFMILEMYQEDLPPRRWGKWQLCCRKGSLNSHFSFPLKADSLLAQPSPTTHHQPLTTYHASDCYAISPLSHYVTAPPPFMGELRLALSSKRRSLVRSIALCSFSP